MKGGEFLCLLKFWIERIIFWSFWAKSIFFVWQAGRSAGRLIALSARLPKVEISSFEKREFWGKCIFERLFEQNRRLWWKAVSFCVFWSFGSKESFFGHFGRNRSLARQAGRPAGRTPKIGCSSKASLRLQQLLQTKSNRHVMFGPHYLSILSNYYNSILSASHSACAPAQPLMSSSLFPLVLSWSSLITRPCHSFSI